MWLNIITKIEGQRKKIQSKTLIKQNTPVIKLIARIYRAHQLCSWEPCNYHNYVNWRVFQHTKKENSKQQRYKRSTHIVLKCIIIRFNRMMSFFSLVGTCAFTINSGFRTKQHVYFVADFITFIERRLLFRCDSQQMNEYFACRRSLEYFWFHSTQDLCLA